MLKLLIIAAAFFWLGRLLVRVFSPARREPKPPPRAPRSGRKKDSLRDLTQQEITDAEFEEIPPEE
jgi:hypothetical protein